jgi:hypothetical protein
MPEAPGGSSSISIVRQKGEITCKWMAEFFRNQFNELRQGGRGEGLTFLALRLDRSRRGYC